MSDPAMLSLFGEEGTLFPDGAEGMGECGYPDAQRMPPDQGYGSVPSGLHQNQNQNPPGLGQPEMGHFDRFGQYEQQGSRPYAAYPGQQAERRSQQPDRRGQAFLSNGSMWGPRGLPEQGPPGPQGTPQQRGAYVGGGEYSLPTHPRTGQFPQGQSQEGGGGLPTNHYMGHMGPQQGPGMAASPMCHPAQQQPPHFHHHPASGPAHHQPHHPGPGPAPTHHQTHQPSPGPAHHQPHHPGPAPHQTHHPATGPTHHQPHQSAPGPAHPQTVEHRPSFSPGPSHAQHQQGMGFRPRGQPLPPNAVNGSGQFSPYPPCPPYSGLSQGPANSTGMGSTVSLTSSSAPVTHAQRYANAGFLSSGSPQRLAHQQPLLHPGQKQQHKAAPPQVSYASAPPMSPLNAVGNPAGTPPPQQAPTGSAGVGVEVGGYHSMPMQPPGAPSGSQRSVGLPPQPYRGVPQSAPLWPSSAAAGHGGSHAEPSQNPLQQAQTALPGRPFQQQSPQPHAHPPAPPPHHPQWGAPHPETPATHQVPATQPSPSDPSSDAAAPGLRPASTSAPLLSSDPAEGDPKPKKKKQKKKKEKASVEGEGEAGAPDSLKMPEGDSPSGEKKKKTKAKEPKEPKTPKAPKTPKTPKTPKEKKAKPATPKAQSSKKTSVKKDDTETGPAKKDAKRKRESPDVSDGEKMPTASLEDEEEEEEEAGVQKRRSSRQVKRKRYTEDLEFRISDDEAEGPGRESNTSPEQREPADPEGPIVEKIMSMRVVKKEMESGKEQEVEEFYVKFKNLSYLHCRWADMTELEKDKRIQQKVKRFKAKQSVNDFLGEMDDEPFNPDYVEVDRILDVSESTDENGEPVTHYLVKWCSLPYEDSTWELKADIDQGKIQEFERLMAREPDLERMKRPPADDWQKLECSRQYKNSNELREYQLEGVNWLLFNWYNTRNCILADEMGLGKTIQSITFLYEIFLKGIRGPFLVIAPLSTIPNWEREFRTWTHLNVVVYHGSQASRRTIQAYEMNFRDAQGAVIKGAYKFHAVITTFEMILTDCPELRGVGWRCVVIDEAHRLKNRNCKLLEGLKMLDMEHKVLLTGTPLQNTVEELFSLLHFLEPQRFPSEATFMQEFGDLKTEEQVQQLQAILKPMMLRRLKEDVEKNLAPKQETIIEVELTNIQKKYYRAILEKNFAFLAKTGGGGGNANVPNLLNTMMELRKCCNHPYLINGAEEKIVEEFRESHPSEGGDFHLQAMIQAAGKLVLIDKLLPKLKAGGHRVLIFSQMVRCLDILEDYLIQKRYPYERIDGRVRGNLRQAAIDRFSRPDSDRFVFLLCTRAGGLGINLTAADTCVIFDSDWNPQNDLQAQARCHRIGQSKAVKIYRLITRNSYEREMFDKASLKLGLDKAVLQSMSGRENAANGVQQLSKKEIEDLLRKGAYGALMEAEDEGSKFCEEDIDQILQRRTQTITIDSEGKGSTFAKASFVAAGNRSDISLEDPDFWQKWAKKAELNMDTIKGRNTLVIDTPRVRKQTQHFSAAKDDELLELSELESDSEDTPVPKPRRPQDRSLGYPRSACFRVEKNLLVYGWGRWADILSHGRFKRPLSLRDVESICRALLVYCVQHYRGDESIKSFIWELITPTEDGQTRDLLNHSGLSAPVPRGRKGKKVKPQATQPYLRQADWLANCNPSVLLQEDSYKKHLKHHCNKVLLRVRMLYYLRQEVIGSHADRVLEGADASEIDVWIPPLFLTEGPSDWWDREADKSLLIGVFKHGYEKYNSMRADPALCFLEKVGMPDPKAYAAEQRGTDLTTDAAEGGDFDRADEDPEYKPARMAFKEELDDFTNSPMDDKEEAMDTETQGKSGENGGVGNLYWPTTSALTSHLRRLIAAYQRGHKREQLRQEALLRVDCQRRPFPEDVHVTPPDREALITGRRQRWTRREEADFYRVVSTLGVMYDARSHRFDWTQFRRSARLERRSDACLERYFLSFVAMCRRVCRMPDTPEEEPPDPTLWIEPITEERASRTLYRIELLRRIREQVLPHPALEERLRLCRPAADLPEWWECGRHDRDLLLGASRHGVSRTDAHILNDPQLGFLEAHRRFVQRRSGRVPTPPPTATPTPAKTEDADSREEEQEEAERSSPKGEVQDEGGKVKQEGGGGEAKAGEEEGPKAGEEEGPKAGEREGPKAGEGEGPKAGEREGPKVEGEAEPNAEGDEGVPLKAPQKEEPHPQECGEVPSGSEPKPLPERGSEEDEEDKMEEDDKSESSQAEASVTSQEKAYDEESNTSLSAADGNSSAAQTYYDRSFPYTLWPKDRVIIDRLDDICEAVMKGKWPANRRQLFDLQGLLPGYAPAAGGGPMTRGFAELSMVGQAGYSHGGGEDTALSPQVAKDEALGTQAGPERRRGRRVEAEVERAAKRRHLMEMVAQLRESHATAGQDPPSSFPLPGAGRANGTFPDGDLTVKRRRGRRKNVEGLDLLFGRNARRAAHADDSDGVRMPPRTQRNIPSPGRREPGTPLSTGNPEDRSRPLGGAAPTNKNLNDWLRQHPSYSTDTASYVPKNEDLLLSAFHKPKQKRHRCRNPNKIDVNTLTGGERVPVVNRRNGRKMGGAMAPPLKDLARWLQENPEFAVSPDWTDIVKQSGFLPESMFGGLLTGPVVREEGPCRRGRRPRSETVKASAAAAASPAGVNPLLMGGLLGGLDLASLQNLQSLQLAGLLGFPPGDPKQAAALLPFMLPGMAGLPNVFGLGGLFGNLATAAGSAPVGQGEAEEGASPKKEKTSKEEAKEEEEEEEDEMEEEGKEKVEEGKPTETEGGAAINPASAAAAAAAMSSSPLAFNPFLLSTMAQGLFYPSMFLPPGLGGLSLPGLPQAALASLQSAMAAAGTETSGAENTTESGAEPGAEPGAGEGGEDDEPGEEPSADTETEDGGSAGNEEPGSPQGAERDSGDGE
ncbi:chromodomain-helicase-DNA-binding protein 7-like [Megalops cyprinoides]|uniref:chromodomain-helicase-DNA-binding protein 7-like n=1 Tax=Megalops cyprinoides TaxID=118141 RepID=UPI0018649E04|nr:chromodomain-helicase-DNA-binding protein 7-like [Megalops cyprinoides]